MKRAAAARPPATAARKTNKRKAGHNYHKEKSKEKIELRTEIILKQGLSLPKEGKNSVGRQERSEAEF